MSRFPIFCRCVEMIGMSILTGNKREPKSVWFPSQNAGHGEVKQRPSPTPRYHQNARPAVPTKRLVVSGTKFTFSSLP